MLGTWYFFMLVLLSADFFFKINFSKIISFNFRNFESNQQDTVNRTDQQEEGSEHQDTEQDQQELEICNESEVNPTPKKTMESDFFEKRTITTVVQPRKKRKFVPPNIAGSLFKKTNEQILKDSAQKTLTKKKQAIKNQKGTSKVKCSKTAIPKTESGNLTNDPRPSTSGTIKVGGPIDLSQSSDRALGNAELRVLVRTFFSLGRMIFARQEFRVRMFF